jgi:hypothetical protein
MHSLLKGWWRVTESNAVFHRALQTLLVEIFNGPPAEWCFVLNPKDPGLLRQLESIDAAAASRRAMPGRTTIAAHVDHVLYGIELLNRWADGEPNPWQSADWQASWKRGTVDERQWRELVGRLRRASEAWQGHVKARSDWDDVSAAGALASVTHAAYHLGAIRQILAAMELNRAPG